MPLPIQVVQFGSEASLVALSGEPVIDWAHKLQEESADGREQEARKLEILTLSSPLPAPAIWVAGYCNDIFDYVPTRRIQAEGGYEGGRANLWNWIPTPFTEDIEDRITAAVGRLVEGSQGRTGTATIFSPITLSLILYPSSPYGTTQNPFDVCEDRRIRARRDARRRSSRSLPHRLGSFARREPDDSRPIQRRRSFHSARESAASAAGGPNADPAARRDTVFLRRDEECAESAEADRGDLRRLQSRRIASRAEGTPTTCSLFARIPGDWKYDWIDFRNACRKSRFERPAVAERSSA